MKKFKKLVVSLLAVSSMALCVSGISASADEVTLLETDDVNAVSVVDTISDGVSARSTLSVGGTFSTSSTTGVGVGSSFTIVSGRVNGTASVTNSYSAQLKIRKKNSDGTYTVVSGQPVYTLAAGNSAITYSFTGLTRNTYRQYVNSVSNAVTKGSISATLTY